MSRTSIFEKRWLDLVFEGKNKAYGAYQLRLENRKTSMLALFYGLAFTFGIAGGGFALSSFNSKPGSDAYLPPFDADTIVVRPVTLPETEAAKPPAPPQPKSDDAKPNENWRNPEVVPPTQVNTEPENETPSTGSTAAGTETAGTAESGSSDTFGSDAGTNAGTATTESGPEIPATLDKQPLFPGGIERLYEAIVKTYDRPEMESSAPVRIMVSFVVEKDGSMTGIKVLNQPGEKFSKEAVRVLKSIRKKWEPGVKNGRPVRTIFTLPIVLKP